MASPREIKRQVEKIELRRKLGKQKGGPGSLRPLIPESERSSWRDSTSGNGESSDEYAVRQAAQRLGEPNSRLVDEIFWFWPLDMAAAKKDPALESVLAGNYQAAASVWKQAEDKGIRTSIANHNLAVFHHRAALNYVRALGRLQLSAQSRQDLEFQWREAHLRWERLVEQNQFWDALADRIRALEDPRLTPTAAAEVRRALPAALLLLGARMLISAAENGQSDEIPRYSSLIHGSPFKPEHREAALRIAVTPIRERISVACSSAEERTVSDPVHADETVRSMLNGGGVSNELAIIDALLPAGHPTRVGIHDQAALQLLSCVIAFSNRTEDYAAALELLSDIKKVAESESAITKVEEQIKRAKEYAESDLRWYGPAYHDAPAGLFAELERARSQFELQNWDSAIDILRESLRTWTGEQASALISKPLAFCLFIRAGTSFSKAIRSNAPVWGRPTYSQVEAVRAAIRAAARDLVEALELDPGNREINKSYDQIRSYASSARVSIPAKPRQAKAAAPTTSGAGIDKAPPRRPPVRTSGGFDASGFLKAILVIGAIILALVFCSNQSSSTSSSRSNSNTGGVSVSSATRTPWPTSTRVPTRIPTRTPQQPSCLQWDEVGLNLQGRYACVYGRIVRVYAAEPYVQIIRFSEQPGYFLMRGEYYYFEGVSEGQCVQVEGTIQQSASYPYMDIDDQSTRLGEAYSWLCES